MAKKRYVLHPATFRRRNKQFFKVSAQNMADLWELPEDSWVEYNPRHDYSDGGWEHRFVSSDELPLFFPEEFQELRETPDNDFYGFDD